MFNLLSISDEIILVFFRFQDENTDPRLHSTLYGTQLLGLYDTVAYGTKAR